ncbi:MAG: hypothetical protein JNJ46_27880 [Myxococcales bacterium]|nr:hypothetical protein [Myxococcales bacterium]
MDITPSLRRYRKGLLAAGLVGATAAGGFAAHWHIEHRHLQEPALPMAVADALTRPNVRVRLTDGQLDCARTVVHGERIGPIVAVGLPSDSVLLSPVTQEPCDAASFRREGQIVRVDSEELRTLFSANGVTLKNVWTVADADDPQFATWIFAAVAVVLLFFGSLGFLQLRVPDAVSLTEEERQRLHLRLTERPLHFAPSLWCGVWSTYLGLYAFAAVLLLGVIYGAGQIQVARLDRARWSAAQPVEGDASILWDPGISFIPSLLATANVAWRIDVRKQEDYSVLWKSHVHEPIALRVDSAGVLTSAAVELVPQRIALSVAEMMIFLSVAAACAWELRKTHRQHRTLKRMAVIATVKYLPLIESEHLSQYGIPNGVVIYVVRNHQGRPSKHAMKKPRAPVFDEAGTAVLALTLPDAEPILVAADGYPLRRERPSRPGQQMPK